MSAASPLRVLVAAGPDPGHALPALGVAAALVRHGHAVRFAGGETHRALSRSLEVPWTALPLLAPTPQDDDLGHRLWRRGADMAIPLAAAVRSWSPQMVVADTLTTAGRFLAGLLDVPWVEVIPHHLPDPDPDLPPVGLGRRPAGTPWRRWDDRRLSRLQQRSLARGAEHADRVARDLGLPAAPPATLRLVATLPDLERPRRTWPAQAHVVGPLAVDPFLPPLEPPPGDDPLVLVTDTTASGVDHRGLTDIFTRAFAHTDLRVVVTSGRLPARRETRLVVGRGPHGPLLAAAQVAVGHGGGGFTAKAFAFGVPQVVVPIHGDQHEAAARVRDTGAGRVLPLRRLTPRRLRWAVLRLLATPQAAAAAGRLQVQAAALGPDLAARLVVAAAQGAPPRSTGPAHHLTQG